MKLQHSVLGAVLAATALLATSAQGQDEPGRWYLKADAGGSWMDDVDFNEFLGPLPSGSKLSLDPGIRLGVAGGYQMTDWFAAEAEFGMLANEIDSVTGAWAVDGALAQFPLMLNAKFQFRNRTAFTPYAGAGLGFSTMVMDLDALGIGDTYLHGTEADMVFAWQAFAGLRYSLNEQISLGVEYRFLASDNSEFEVDTAWFTPSNKLKLGEVETHSVSFTFNYQF